MQVGFGTVRQLDEPKTLAGVEPEHLGVDGVRGYGPRDLKIARLGNPAGKASCSLPWRFPRCSRLFLYFPMIATPDIESALHLP